MSKILLAGGDSFTWGNELSDSKWGSYSELSWARLLSKDLNYQYKCIAKPGCGNHAIARKIIDYCDSNTVDIVAVMWSFPVRQEIRIRDDLANEGKTLAMVNDEIDDNWINLVQWQGLEYEDKLPNFGSISSDPSFQKKLKDQSDWHKNTGIQSIAKTLFTLLDRAHHEYISLESIALLQMYLEKRNIPFVFSGSTEQVFDLINSKHPLANVIDKKYWINNIGFYDWAKANNYKLHPMHHPEDRAHRDWVDLYYKDFVEQYKQ